jgi:predicted RND superfamily exporter protein
LNTLHHFRYYLLGLIALLGILLFPGVKQALQIDNSLTSWFIEGDPALEPYYKLQESFGNDEVVVLAYDTDLNVLIPSEALKLQNLIDSLEQQSSVRRVLHPFELRKFSRNPLNPRGSKIIKSDAKKSAQNLKDYPFFRAQFFNEELSAIKLYIQLESSPDFELKRAEIIQNIYRITNHFLDEDRSYFGGLGVIYEALNELSAKDFATFLGLGYLLMFTLIAVLYRHWTFTLYAIISISLASYFTLAIYGATGHHLNLLSTLIPTIIILLGVMDIMHILNELKLHAQDVNPKVRALNALKEVWTPCLFTSISTMAGFLSLTISPVAILAEFGLFAALGIALALLFSFLLGTIFLVRAPLQSASNKTSTQLEKLQLVVLRKKNIIITAFVLFSLAALGSIPYLRVDTESVGYLPETHQARIDSDKIEALFGPYMPLDYLIEVPEGSDLSDPKLMSAFYAFDQKVSALPEVGSMTGLHDIYASALEARYGTEVDKNWDKEQFLQLVSLQAKAQAPELWRSFWSEDENLGRFYLSGNLVSAATLKGTMHQVDSLAKATLGDKAIIKAAGYQSLYARIVNYVTQSQIESFSLAGILIFGLLWFFLRDLKLSLISLIPNFFPVLVLLAIMVWFNIALDTATASIASIVLSFSIDDTMHFIWHYRKKRKSGKTAAEARSETISHVGRAIVFTSLVLFSGYALMWFGSLKTVIYFGTLTAASIAAALVSQLFLFPILLERFDRDTSTKEYHEK